MLYIIYMKFIFENFGELKAFYNEYPKIFKKNELDKEIIEFSDNGDVYDTDELQETLEGWLEDVDDINEYIDFFVDLLSCKYIDTIKQFIKNNKIEDDKDSFKYNLVLNKMILFLQRLYRDNIKPTNIAKKINKGYDYSYIFHQIHTIIQDKYEEDINDWEHYDLFTIYRNKNIKDTKEEYKMFLKNKDDIMCGDNDEEIVKKFVDLYIKYLKKF